jgi:hypothetical protein
VHKRYPITVLYVEVSPGRVPFPVVQERQNTPDEYRNRKYRQYPPNHQSINPCGSCLKVQKKGRNGRIDIAMAREKPI